MKWWADQLWEVCKKVVFKISIYYIELLVHSELTL